jgi:hypothetical protein
MNEDEDSNATPKLNYNPVYLAGDVNTNDDEYVATFNIPAVLAYTPALNDWMLDKVYKDQINDFMETGMSEGNAEEKARRLQTLARKNINQMLARAGRLHTKDD